MSRLATRAEIQKFARLLETDAAGLALLEDLDADLLRAAREGIAEALFKLHASHFQLLAKLSGLVPVGVTAQIARHALGAYLAGRVAGEMPPKRAIAVAAKLPAEFLADVSLAIEPQRAQAVIAGIPASTVESVALLLVKRREFVTMGRFVGAISQDALDRVINLLSDEALLHTGFYVEDATRIDAIVASLSDARLRNMIHTATEQDLWPEALSLVQLVGDAQKGRLGDLTAGEDSAVLDSLVHVAQAQGLWPEVLVAVASMSQDNQRLVVNLPSVTEPQVLDTLIATAHAHDLWRRILPLVALMQEQHQAAAVSAALAQDENVIRGWLDAAGEADLMPDALRIFGARPEDLRDRMVQQMQAQAREGGGGKLAGLVAALDVAVKQS